MPLQPHQQHSPPPQQELLLVDAGNSRVKFGLFRERSCESETESVIEPSTVPRQLPRCDGFVASPVDDPELWQTVRAALTVPEDGPRAVITGSNPQQIERLVSQWPTDWPRPDVLTDRGALPIGIGVEEPQRVGIDRLLDAIAANALRPAEAPAIIIDVGTATTVNAVSKSGMFIGGAILPGPELCARALHEYTAVLPHVPLSDLSSEEPAVIGRNTEAAIKSGLYWGHWQAVLGYCERMRSPLGCPPEPLVLLTGGAAHLYADRIPPGARYEPHLTLQGLAIAARHLFAHEAQP